MKQIEILTQTKHVIEVLTHYNVTDEFCDFLISKGREIVCVSYGFYNELDLIVYEV